MAGTMADDNPSFSNWNALARMEAFGLLRSRPGDRMGVAGWYNGISERLHRPGSHRGCHCHGTTGEWKLYYNREITPWFHLTRDLQVLQNSTARHRHVARLGCEGS